MEPENLKTLGIDDWLIFARDTTNGKLYYTNVELHLYWKYAPYGGHQDHGAREWKQDWQYMFLTTIFHPNEFDWIEADHPLNMSDNNFQLQTMQRFW